MTVLNGVVSFLLFLAQVVIVAGVGVLSYFVFAGRIAELREEIPTLNYFLTPVVVIVIGTWFVAHSFMGKVDILLKIVSRTPMLHSSLRLQ